MIYEVTSNALVITFPCKPTSIHCALHQGGNGKVFHFFIEQRDASPTCVVAASCLQGMGVSDGEMSREMPTTRHMHLGSSGSFLFSPTKTHNSQICKEL